MDFRRQRGSTPEQGVERTRKADMARRLVAGVDSSTQSTKVVVCDAETGEVVRTGRAPHPDGTSVDPERWWEAYRLATADGLLDGVEAIAVGGQQHGMVALDEDDAVVRDALLWNDVRSAADARDVVREFGGPARWVEACDVVPLAAFTVSKVRWLAAHEPENAERVKTIVLPHDWLTGRILKESGGFTGWTTDRGDASGTGYWSPVTGEYRKDLQELAFGRVFEVPRVLGPNEPAGSTDSGVLVAAGTGDNMGAALGLGIEPGDVVVSLGTSGTVFAVHDATTGDTKGEIAGFASADGARLPLMCTLNAARVLTAGATMLGVDLEALSDLALSAPIGAEGLTLLPYLDGERTPDLPDATGTLGGLTRANATPANFARACVEGMLANLAAGVDGLRSHGIEARRIVLIGGASASPVVQAVAPILFGVPVHVPAPGEYVGIGAARQAAWALLGGKNPPEWKVEYTNELTANADDIPRGAQVLERYRALVHQMHG